MRFFRSILLALMCAFALQIEAQTCKAEASLDSMTIVIGGQVGFNVVAAYPEGVNAVFHQLSDTITKDIEIVEVSPIDTVVSNGIVQLMQRYLVTSFDSGLHYIPPIDILEIDGGQKAQTNDMALNVVNPFQNIQVDEQTHSVAICDVKDVKDAPFTFAEFLQYWPWIVIALVLIVASYFIYRYYQKRKALARGEKPSKPKFVEPCDVIAMRSLEKIKEEKLWQKNQFKEYYSSITDTLRKYVSERYGVNAMESTTDEIMTSLDGIVDDKADCNQLRNVLETADFVKFAKHEPLPDENDMAMKHAMEFVQKTRSVAANNSNADKSDAKREEAQS